MQVPIQNRKGFNFNPKAHHQKIKVGDTMVKAIQMPIMDPQGKFRTHYMKEILLGDVVKQMDTDVCEIL